MAPRSEDRAKGVDLPPWWLDMIRPLVDERGESLVQLGKSLAAAVGRSEKWDHSMVSRYLRNINTTVPMTEAFAALFGLPSPLVFAQSIEEAHALHATSLRFAEPKTTPDQARRLALVDQARVSQEEASQDQTRPVKSAHERVSRGGGTRRVARRRAPSS